MFNKDFYPTPSDLAYRMISGYDLHGKVVLEPSAGKGDLVDVLKHEGADVLACELNEDLRKIVATKCKVIESDFLKLTSDKVSHIHFIVMNPPFSADEKHILHAWEIAPAGCTIIALCNLKTVENKYSRHRQNLSEIIGSYGNYEDVGNSFEGAERSTKVEIAIIRIQKPADDYKTEFNGFFMGEDAPEAQENALMSYNVVRDLVNRYIESMKLFDKQMDIAEQMQAIGGIFFTDKLGHQITENGRAKTRTELKKDIQKCAWNYIFEKMDLQKFATQGLRESINKFVEEQGNVPFTMRNIYQMIGIVIGTTSQRMDKALEEVFDKLTKHYDENRYFVEGWKTNSHYLVNKRFIFSYAAELDWDKQYVKFRHYQRDGETLKDFEKALCYMTGVNYDEIKGILNGLPDKLIPGQWYPTHFFNIRAYKKGTVHCEFNDEELWAKYNQHIARVKGYPLYEAVKTKDTERRNAETAKNYHQR